MIGRNKRYVSDTVASCVSSSHMHAVPATSTRVPEAITLFRSVHSPRRYAGSARVLTPKTWANSSVFVPETTT